MGSIPIGGSIVLILERFKYKLFEGILYIKGKETVDAISRFGYSYTVAIEFSVSNRSANITLPGLKEH
jgi:hypothetical protein